MSTNLFFQFSLVVAVSKPRTFIGKQCHQRLGHHEIGRRHQFVFFCHSPQETGQELPLDWIIYCGQIHPGGSWYQILEEKQGKAGDKKKKKISSSAFCSLSIYKLFMSFSSGYLSAQLDQEFGSAGAVRCQTANGGTEVRQTRNGFGWLASPSRALRGSRA